jgi:hypothetical protein
VVDLIKFHATGAHFCARFKTHENINNEAVYLFIHDCGGPGKAVAGSMIVQCVSWDP